MKSIKVRSAFYKFCKIGLFAVIVGAFAVTALFIADRQFSLEMELPLWVLIFLWAAAWMVLLLCLMTFTKLFTTLITTFNETEIIIFEETVRIEKRTTRIPYKDILEIDSAKPSAIRTTLRVYIGKISIRVGRMRIKYTEPQHYEGGNTVIETNLPYSAVKAAIKAFNLDIKLVKDQFSF